MYPKGYRTVVVSYVLTSVAFFFILLKLGTRFFVVGAPGWDDLIIVLSFMLLIPLCMTMYYQAHYGMGALSTILTKSEIANQYEWFWASTWIYEFSFGLAKISILVQYLRIFVYERTRIATYIMIAFMAAYIIQVVLVGIFQCVPVEALWDKSMMGRCINSFTWYYATAGLNIFSDVMIILLPIPALISLQVPLRQRLGLMAIFAVGGFGCITSMVRLYVLTRSTGDFSAANADAAMWSVIENCVAIICATLPSLRPLLSHFFPYLRDLSKRSSNRDKDTTTNGSNSRTRFAFETTSASRFGLRRLVSKPNLVPYEERKKHSLDSGLGHGKDANRSYSDDVALRAAGDDTPRFDEQGVEVTHTLENYVTTASNGRHSQASEQSDLAFARSLGMGGPTVLEGQYRSKVSTSPV